MYKKYGKVNYDIFCFPNNYVENRTTDRNIKDYVM